MAAWGGIVGWILQIILKMIPIFVNKKEEQEKLQKKIQEEIEKYQKGVKNAAKVREEHQKLDTKLDEEWEKKFGKKPEPVPEIPTEVNVNDAFMFYVELPETAKNVEVWAEKQFRLGYMAWNSAKQRWQIPLSFNKAGVRVINVKADDEWKITKTITVRG